jgi:hypothetical protein
MEQKWMRPFMTRIAALRQMNAFNPRTLKGALVIQDGSADVAVILPYKTFLAMQRATSALLLIREATRTHPNERGSDANGDCSLPDCECSNHIARRALGEL